MIAERDPENATVVVIVDGTGRGSAIGVAAQTARITGIRMEAAANEMQPGIVGPKLEP